MITMVRFRTGESQYCLAVDATRAVRTTSGLLPLPQGRSDVVGILPGDPPLTVIAPFGAGGDKVLVVEAGQKTFGVLVDSVTGLTRVDESDIRPAPDGQDRRLICGTFRSDGELTLVTDPEVLVGRL
ncbi:chemotaxis protein CheW [Lentzea nigeriaca]|uniref:chemotaxis protein CheW n=1 Tax=Lentzea nigeriaca TaxID=1128665 RepID=UPI00195DA794|nr:chemotaxis protein CheW [Lentzea nigeriaca]MBM7857259.1 chemotaxis signal transduction protein [Lentzea nigeriaca]